MNRYKSFVDLAKVFDMFKEEHFINHRGCLVEKAGVGYKLSGRYFPSMKAIDDELDRQFGKWSENVKKQNNG